MRAGRGLSCLHFILPPWLLFGFFFVPLYVDFNVLLNAEWIWRTKEYTG